jgi:hypothetical protein
MAGFAVQHSMQDESNLSADRYVNTFYASHTGVTTPAYLQALRNAVIKFYTYNIAGGALDTYFSPTVNGNNSTLKIYDLDTLPPRAPIHQYSFKKVVTAAGQGVYPAEVALAITLRAAPVAGIKAARLRGRLYIGPLRQPAGVSAGTAGDRPTAAMMTDFTTAVQGLVNDLAALNPITRLQVYSPTIRGSAPTSAGAMHQVVEASVDNAWDTQHRRGRAGTTRTTLALI